MGGGGHFVPPPGCDEPKKPALDRVKQYLRNFATFTKIYWRTRFRNNFFCQDYKLLPWQSDFRRHV